MILSEIKSAKISAERQKIIFKIDYLLNDLLTYLFGRYMADPMGHIGSQ